MGLLLEPRKSKNKKYGAQLDHIARTYDKMQIRFRKDSHEIQEIKNYAAERGESMASFVKRAIFDTMRREKNSANISV